MTKKPTRRGQGDEEERHGADREPSEDLREDAWPYGPYTDPLDRYKHLPERTRKWLEGLSEKDLEAIDEALSMLDKAKTIGKAAKWTVVTILAGLVAGASAGDSILKMLKWFGR